MIRVPIYQMAYNFNDPFGLVFPSEIDDDNQSILFVIPKYIEGNMTENQIENLLFYFPFDLNNEYLELTSSIENSLLTFEAPLFNSEIQFKVDFENEFLKNNGFDIDLNYVGKHSFADEIKSFVVIIPLDIKLMDRLYFRTKGLFIGLTPDFNSENKI